MWKSCLFAEIKLRRIRYDFLKDPDRVVSVLIETLTVRIVQTRNSK